MNHIYKKAKKYICTLPIKERVVLFLKCFFIGQKLCAHFGRKNKIVSSLLVTHRFALVCLDSTYKKRSSKICLIYSSSINRFYFILRCYHSPVHDLSLFIHTYRLTNRWSYFDILRRTFITLNESNFKVWPIH